MQERKFKIGFVTLSYGGNGGIRSEIPEIREWMIGTVIKAKSDPRVSEVIHKTVADTPVTMVRNNALLWAKQNGVDFLVMVDSDNAPDIHLGQDADAQPFWDTSFDFAVKHYDLGPVVIGSPYCGPPPIENCYTFRWRNSGSSQPHCDMKLDAYTREEAELMSGIHPCAALPTGVILIDVRCADLIGYPYFDYEWEDDGPKCDHCGQNAPGPRAHKCTTEDVYFSRNVSLNGLLKYNRDLVFCNWSAWAGHMKPLMVSKPRSIKADHVAKSLRDAVLKGVYSDQKIINLERPKNLPLPAAGVQVVEGSPHRNVEVQNGQPIPVGAGSLQPEIVAKHLMTTDDLEQLDVQVDTKYVELHALQVKVAHECVKKRGKKMVIVEVGSFTGRSAVAMADGVEPGQDFELHCVDHFNGSGTDFTRTLVRQLAKKHGPDVLYKAFQARIEQAGISDRVHVHRLSSLEAAARWDKNKPIDVLFLDAGHTYEELRDDIAAWKPLMAEDGLIIGHDYCKEFPGVEQAVVEAFGDATVIHSLWMVKRGVPLEPDTMFDIALGRTGFEDESVAVPNAQFREFVPSLNGGVHASGE